MHIAREQQHGVRAPQIDWSKPKKVPPDGHLAPAVLKPKKVPPAGHLAPAVSKPKKVPPAGHLAQLRVESPRQLFGQPGHLATQ